MASFVNLKIDKRAMDNILEGRSRGNRLVDTLEDYGNRIANQARENTMTARNNQAKPYDKKNSGKGGAGVRKVRFFGGSAGRYATGQLANSFKAQRKTGAGAPEVRVGSSDSKFEYHEFGTKSTGWGRGILPGHMLKDAVSETTGRGTSAIAGRSIYKNVSSPYKYIN